MMSYLSKLTGEDLSRYLSKTESVGLRKACDLRIGPSLLRPSLRPRGDYNSNVSNFTHAQQPLFAIPSMALLAASSSA